MGGSFNSSLKFFKIKNVISIKNQASVKNLLGKKCHFGVKMGKWKGLWLAGERDCRQIGLH